MAREFTNQASLTYDYTTETGIVSGSAISNIATGELTGPLTLEKTSFGSTYRNDSEKIFILTFSNISSVDLTNVEIVDNLGTYTFGSLTLTPLTFNSDTAPLLFINGEEEPSRLTVDSSRTDSVTFLINVLPANSNATIIYSAYTNEFARRGVGNTITNTATANADGLTEDVTAQNTMTVAQYANVSILKSMCPTEVLSGDEISYTFYLYNYGNLPANNITLSDRFSPELTGITVTLNGTTVPSSQYNYADGLLTIPGEGASLTISVPAATFVRNTATGAITVNPGVTELVVTGRV